MYLDELPCSGRALFCLNDIASLYVDELPYSDRALFCLNNTAPLYVRTYLSANFTFSKREHT